MEIFSTKMLYYVSKIFQDETIATLFKFKLFVNSKLMLNAIK